MAQLIDKAAVVAEIDDRRDKIKKGIFSIPLSGRERSYATFEYEILGRIKDFIDTLDVKEVVEHDESDLDIVLSELGVEPDSSFAKILKDAFYKGIDSYLNKKD